MNYIRIECPYHLLDALGAIHLVMKVNKICGEFSLFSTGGKKFKNDIFEVNYPPTPEVMGWASGVNTPTNVGSSS